MPLEYAEIPTKDTRYAYTTGRIRALEVDLLEEADFSRMKQVDKVGEVLGILAKIFPYSESMKDIKEEKEFEKGLDKELKRTYKELRYFCPEPDLVDLFWLENDFYNLKVLLKIHFQKKLSKEIFVSLKPALSLAGTLDIRVLGEAVEKEDFTQLPSHFRTLLEKTFPLVENNPHPQFLDSFLDREFFQWLWLKTQKYSDSFLSHLIQLWIDSFNIKAFLRIKSWQKELLEEVLVEGGLIDKGQLLQLSYQGIQALVDEFKNANYPEAVKEALEEWEKEGSLFILDKFFNECILKHTYCGFYITFAREPLVNYIFLKKCEIKRLRIILRTKLAGISIQEFKCLK
ncbi:V-type ATPase subunit [Candidatus Aerophobetes bacterium]|nr:V-type ATPase subunit [Candidatus Aerophobetes bacterium]